MGVDSTELILNITKSVYGLNRVDASLLIGDIYEDIYGIYPHLTNKSRPMASVAFHPSEDINTGSLLEESINSFAKRGIYSTFGINYLEFLALPQDICYMLSIAALNEMKIKSGMIDDIEKNNLMS